MIHLRDLPVRKKLTLIIMVTSSVALLMACGLFIADELNGLHREMRHRLSLLSDVIGANSEASLAFKDQRDAEGTLNTLRAEEPIVCAALYDSGGALFARYVRDNDGTLLPPPKPGADGSRFENGHLVQFSPIVVDGERMGTLFLSSDLQEMRRSIRHDGVIAGAVLVMCLAVAFILSSRLQRVISNPIHDLARTARAVGENKDFSVRAIKQSQDDIGVLIDAFNGMLEQVQARDQALQRAHTDLELRVQERTRELVQEIAEHKRAQEDLERAKLAAEAASRAKGQFLANMSHEIRTPMNGIIGMADLVLDSKLSSEQRQHLNLLKGSADVLLTLLNDILDFSKIEAGKLDLDPIDFGLRDVLDHTMKACSLRAHDKGLELACHVLPEVPDSLAGDPGRLRQILTNLVGNAIKFTERGEVAVQVSVETEKDVKVQLHFAIKDTGIGIPSDKREAIFNPFTQADGSMTRRYGGTGLGLTISRQLVEMMGGLIWVESTEGAGSTFHFTATFSQASARAASPAPRQDLKGLNVLVVDDNATNRQILKEMLATWGIRAALTDGARAAIESLQEAKRAGRPFGLVLLDASMPDVDGFTLAGQLRRDPSTSKTTIMMLTSAGQRGDAARCRKIGIAAYLTKPITQSELLDAIMTTLGPPHSRARATPLVTRHSLRENRRRFTILLAEDNQVNQMVAVRTLEKRGHTVTVANNGQEALDLLDKGPFDLVLMDIQMPEMGGFETTAAIRKKEKGTKTHLPIVAMTAHAMKGDRERCLQAGMDGYVPKPIDARDLFQAIDRAMGVTSSVDPPAQSQPKPDSAFDPKAALERVGDDFDLLLEMSKLFLETCPAMMQGISKAIETQDARALREAAHTLKGSVGNFSAAGAVAAAQRLETLGEDGHLESALEAYGTLRAEIDRLIQALAHLRETHAA